MNKLLLLLAVTIAACTSQEKTEKHGNEKMAQEHTTTDLQLNKGSKWKADLVTKNNVAAMVQVVNDTRYANPSERNQLHASLQTKIDTLVNQCKMEGPDHEALHTWLQKVLKDMKEWKEKEYTDDYAYAALKKDIESFYAFFE